MNSLLMPSECPHETFRHNLSVDRDTTHVPVRFMVRLEVYCKQCGTEFVPTAGTMRTPLELEPRQ